MMPMALSSKDCHDDAYVTMMPMALSSEDHHNDAYAHCTSLEKKTVHMTQAALLFVLQGVRNMQRIRELLACVLKRQLQTAASLRVCKAGSEGHEEEVYKVHMAVLTACIGVQTDQQQHTLRTA